MKLSSQVLANTSWLAAQGNKDAQVSLSNHFDFLGEYEQANFWLEKSKGNPAFTQEAMKLKVIA